MFKKSVVIKAKPIRSVKNIHIDYTTVILFTLFICGIICGIALFKIENTEWGQFIANLLKSYLSSKAENGIFGCFCTSFLLMSVLVLCNFISGMCAFGIPIISAVPFVFGLFCSVCISAIFVNYGLNGLFYCVVTNVPCFAITAAVLIKGCCESVKMSLELFATITNQKKADGKKTNLFKDYTVLYLVLCIPIIVGALISAVNFKLFSNLFVFV